MAGQVVGELVVAIGEVDDRRGAVRDRAEVGRGTRRAALEKLRRDAGRRGEDHRLGRHPLAAAEPDPDARPVELEALEQGVGPDPDVGHRPERLDERVDELLRPTGERHERRGWGRPDGSGRTGSGRTGSGGPLPRPGIGERREEERSVAPLGFPELRDDRIQAQLVDRRPVDAADERSGQPVHERAAEAAPEERPDGDVAAVRVARQDEVQAMRALASGEKRRSPGTAGTSSGGRGPCPSGKRRKRPPARMKTTRGSCGRTIASPRPSSRQSWTPAGR